MRTPGLIRTAALVAVAGLVLAGCSSGSGSGQANGESGLLKIGSTVPIDSLNPFVAQSDYSAVVFQYVYPHLVQYDAKLDLVADYASKWTTSKDGRTWTFTTAPNATWSDGKPLTAEDAAWTINTILKYQNGATANMAGFVAHLDKAAAPTATKLVLTYQRPVANVLAQLQNVDILPEHLWSRYATGDGLELKRFQNGAPMVSGGPFMLTKYEKNQYAVLNTNPTWWGTKPHISGFGLQFFSNEDAMITAIKTHAIDMVGEGTPPTAVDALKAGGLVVSTAPSLSMKTLIINTNPAKTQHRELLDPRVREALEYATDRTSIINTAWLGQATPGTTIIAAASGIWHNDSIPGLPYDLAKANALLDQAGFTRGSDGIRVADGHPMNYDVIFATDEKGTGDRTFQILQTDFHKIGIQINQRTMDADASFNAITAPDGKYQSYDLAMWDWVPPVDPDFMLSVMTCASWGNNSDSGYCNPAYDALYSQQSTLLDPQARKKVVDKMQQIVYDDRPYIILNYPNIIEAHSTSWTGFVMSPEVGSVTNLSMQTLLNVHRVN